MTQPQTVAEERQDAPAPSFSAEDVTEAALLAAFGSAVAAWLSASTAAAMAGAMVPNLSLLLSSADFTRLALPKVRQALADTWVKVYARTGTDLRGFLDGYLMQLPYRLDGLAELANRRATKALGEKLASGDVDAIRRAVRESLTDAEYSGYVNRLAQTEASISVNGARHDLAAVAYRAGARVEKKWMTRRDTKVRHTHHDAQGQTVPFTSPFWVGGVPMQHPGDPTAPISEVANCRCRANYTIHPGR